MHVFACYREIWAADFEFTARPGEPPVPLCCVAREVRSGRAVRLWLQGGAPAVPPYPTGADTLFTAYYASAELGCHLALGWPLPTRVVDLYAEFRCRTCGLPTPCGNGLLGALAYFGLPGMDAAEKESMRMLAVRGGPYTAAEKAALLDYCADDVSAIARLWPVMAPGIDLPRALLRGRYMAAAARIEACGTPIDMAMLERLRRNWGRLKSRLIAAVDARYHVFEPIGRRAINPNTRLGAALVETALEWGVDVYDLADAADLLWQEERADFRATAPALQAARQATRLTAQRINRWEDAGGDHSTWRGLDEQALGLAGMYPELGIGRGYDPDAPDRDDNAARLWERLRQGVRPPPPRHDPGLLRRAAEVVSAQGTGEHAARGPVRFSSLLWERYLARQGIPWPRLPSGALALDDETFREMARRYPAEVGPVRDLRHALSQLRLYELAVGSDGRNRVLLSAFASKTGRNQPSNSRYIFGPSSWLRSLIRPAPGRAVAYVDWEQQEFGIAAALSGDRAMKEAYLSGDPYLAFAKQAGAVPPDATKATHRAEREQFKVCALAVQYGMAAESLARKLGVPPARGHELLRLHQATYPRYWAWSQAVQDEAMLTGLLRTVFGWALHVGPDANPRSIRNFPMQATGGDMLRLACCLATERGIEVCAPVHDALLVEGPADGIEATAAATQEAMREAGEVTLWGFQLRTEAKVVRHPDRYLDERGRGMWDAVTHLLDEIEGEERPLLLCEGWV